MQQIGFFIAKLIFHSTAQQHPANWTYNPQLCTRPTTCKPKRQVPQGATICITLGLLMMGVMVPEACWANSKFCNKETNLLHLVGLLISTVLHVLWKAEKEDKLNALWIVSFYVLVFASSITRPNCISEHWQCIERSGAHKCK